MITSSLRVPLTDASTVGAARREALRIAESAGISEQKASSLGIVVTEMARNVIIHARQGEMLVHFSNCNGSARVAVVTVDLGPGMHDVDACLRDGYSTAGTAGNGLGAVRRLANSFDVYSQAGRGTVVFAGFALDERDGRDGRVDESNSMGIICLPIATEQISGDSCCLVRDGGRLAVVLVDGLGHGPFAAEAARCAIDAFAADPFTTPEDIVRRAHKRMSSTRGGAVAVALVDSSLENLSYAAVGNICTSLVGGGRSRSLMTQNGIVGGAFHGLKEMRYAVDDAGLLIMHSDGLKTRWKLSDYPGLSERHPMVISAVLYRDYARSTDDVSVLVAKLKP